MHSGQWDIISTVHDRLGADQLGLYASTRYGYGDASVFVTRSPEDAIRWLARQVPRSALRKAVATAYKELNEEEEGTASDDRAEVARARGCDALLDREAGDGGEGEEEGEGEQVLEAVMATAVLADRKRKRGAGRGTMAAANALVDRLNRRMVETVANDEDWETALARKGVSNEERAYRRYCERWPGIGLSVVEDFLTKAPAVGCLDALLEWRTIGREWARQARRSTSLFGSQPPPRQEGTLDRRLLLQGGGEALDEGEQGGIIWEVLSHDEALRFKCSFFEAQRSQASGRAEFMRERWRLDKFYEQFVSLSEKFRREGQSTGYRGRTYQDVAKEALFEMVFAEDLGRQPKRHEDVEQWKWFGDMLDWGRRWNILKRTFGTVGIFALMPRGRVPNEWIEKRLSQKLVQHWADLVRECNPDVLPLAHKMAPLFEACMEQAPIPTPFGFILELEEGCVGTPLEIVTYEPLLLRRPSDADMVQWCGEEVHRTG